MVFHHLHRFHILMGNVACGEAILAAKKVVAVDIELVDRLTLIFYGPVLLNLYARKALYHIDNGIVLSIGIARHIEHQRIAFGINVRSLHYHIFQARCTRIEPHIRQIGRNRKRQGLVAHESERH